MIWLPDEQTWLENNRSVLESNNLDRIASRLKKLDSYPSSKKMALVLSATYDVPIFILNHGNFKSVRALFGTTEVGLGYFTKERTDPIGLFEDYKEIYGLPSSWKMEDLKWDDEYLTDKFWHIVKG